MAHRPKQILIMRHAEKPDDKKDPGLSADGQIRAQVLAKYIPANFGVPDLVFASAPTKRSMRPIRTVAPLVARHLQTGISLDVSFTDSHAQTLGHALGHHHGFASKNILVCWHHGYIPELIRAIDVKNFGEIPNPWPKKVFNEIIQIEFKEGEALLRKFTTPF